MSSTGRKVRVSTAYLVGSQPASVSGFGNVYSLGQKLCANNQVTTPTNSPGNPGSALVITLLKNYDILNLLQTSSFWSVNDEVTNSVIVSEFLWLYGVCRGIENEPVSGLQIELPKSIGCSKNFAGTLEAAHSLKAKVQFWLTRAQQGGGGATL